MRSCQRATDHPYAESSVISGQWSFAVILSDQQSLRSSLSAYPHTLSTRTAYSAPEIPVSVYLSTRGASVGGLCRGTVILNLTWGGIITSTYITCIAGHLLSAEYVQSTYYVLCNIYVPGVQSRGRVKRSIGFWTSLMQCHHTHPERWVESHLVICRHSHQALWPHLTGPFGDLRFTTEHTMCGNTSGDPESPSELVHALCQPPVSIICAPYRVDMD